MNKFAGISAMLEALCSAKGVSGAENEAAKVAAEMLGRFMPVSSDALGSVRGRKDGNGPYILLDAHLDQIGLVVRGIDDKGFIGVLQQLHSVIQQKIIKKDPHSTQSEKDQIIPKLNFF